MVAVVFKYLRFWNWYWTVSGCGVFLAHNGKTIGSGGGNGVLVIMVAALDHKWWRWYSLPVVVA